MQRTLADHAHAIERAGFCVVVPRLVGQHLSQEQLIELVPGVVGAIVGDDPVTAQVLDAAPDLRVIVKWGIGMDAIDRDAAEARGVKVVNTPGVFADEVADSVMAYVLLLARGHHRIDAEVRNGQWPKFEGLTLAGQVMGVIGVGSIGSAVAMRAAGFGMEVVGHDPYIAQAPPHVRAMLDLRDLLSRSRVVVLTCPLTHETRRLINSEALACMRSDAFLVNVARGPVVDEAALVTALHENRLAGAGLDVYETEPLPGDSPLRTLTNVILGSHNGSNTREGVERASALAVARLLDLLEAARD
jgi:D-3-phosphoglycerate dehydrogenase